MFRRILIANRGEVAVRIARSCQSLGVTPVFAVSAADRAAPYTREAESVCIGPALARRSYLDRVAVVQAAVQSRCSAVHPGWGFLAEDPVFAALCEAHGVTFIGPPAGVMAQMAKKTPAKRAMAAAGMTVIPGSEGPLASVDEARELAEQVGYPVLLKAESGGGGRGMRVSRGRDDLEQAFHLASREAQAAFGDGRLYLEKLLEGGRHIEVQVLVDSFADAVHLGERDCSVQRNHQKLVEESPAPAIDPEALARTCERAAEAAARIGYVGAGTLELLRADSGDLCFMEMNTRLQVEHGVTEMRTGVDLVAAQLRIAAGEPLGWAQSDLQFTGHVIECRINAEDPFSNFLPSPGVITRWHVPRGDDPDVRVDTHVESGYEVPPYYDSLLAKVLVRGATREAACDKMLEVLSGVVCEGVATTIPLHRVVLASAAFRGGAYDVRSIPGWPPAATREAS